MSLKYFGTDGIRGTFGGSVVNRVFARKLGTAMSEFLSEHYPSKPITIVIGRDTRASGIELQEAISEPFCNRGQHVIYLGVIPTPGISLAVTQLHADLGIAITASHNPAGDNGIKFFDNRGHKLLPEREAEIEQRIDRLSTECPNSKFCGYEHNGLEYYINYLRSLLHQDCLQGWKIVLDCANGATASTTPRIFAQFGAQLEVIGNQPDGQNINNGIGSEHPEALVDRVLKTGARIGIAHDGDGDRLVVCDEKGDIVDGDQLLGLLALRAAQTGNLQNMTLVTTVQSNLGLDFSLKSRGICVERTDVGDRNVLHRMISGNYSLGGEQSGHIIFANHLETGDGALAAIMVVEAMLASKKPISELKQAITLFPQVKANIKVSVKRPLEECPHLQAEMAALEAEMGDQGRLLVRFSGTEAKLRLLAEARTETKARNAVQRLCSAAEKDLEVVL